MLQLCLNKNSKQILMKRLTLSLLLIAASSFSLLIAQTSRPLLAVGDIDANDALPGSGHSTLSEMAMRKMERIGTYELLDQYDMNYLAKRDGISLTGCFSKICLTEMGSKLQVDKMLTGSIRTVGDNITVNFRILDVKSGIIERTHTNDFLKINAEYRNMIEITLDELMGNPVDEEIKKKLTLKNNKNAKQKTEQHKKKKTNKTKKNNEKTTKNKKKKK